MDRAPTFDLLLLGYRNDLARESTLGFLRSLPEHLGAPVHLDREQELPKVIGHDLGHERGLDLAAELRRRGAHVRLVPSASEATVTHRPVEYVTGPRPAKRRLSPRVLLLLLLVAAGMALGRGAEVWRARWGGSGGFDLRSVAPIQSIESVARSRLNDEAVTLNEAGQYAAAAEHVRTALRSDPRQPTLRRNLRTILRNWAISELNAGRFDAAVALLSDTREHEDDPGLLGLLGVAHTRKREWAEARDILERAVRLGAGDPTTYTALGEVYRHQGDRAAAVEMFHRARDRGASGADFDAMLTRLERELDAEWGYDQLRSAHFEISFDSGEDRSIAPVVLASLERAYFEVGRRLDWYPDGRTQVVLYPDEEFHHLTQSPDWTAGIYDGRIKLPVRGLVTADERVDRVLRHEYAHAVVGELTRMRCPTSLNEGVAIWAEEESPGDRIDWALDAIADRPLFSFAELHPMFTKLPAERVPIAYAQSYLAVRSIIDRFGERRLRNMLESLGRGSSLDAAFDEALLTRFATFEEDFLHDLSG
jgi:Flp pilus assembly protein TadD